MGRPDGSVPPPEGEQRWRPSVAIKVYRRRCWVSITFRCRVPVQSAKITQRLPKYSTEVAFAIGTMAHRLAAHRIEIVHRPHQIIGGQASQIGRFPDARPTLDGNAASDVASPLRGHMRARTVLSGKPMADERCDEFAGFVYLSPPAHVRPRAGVAGAVTFAPELKGPCRHAMGMLRAVLRQRADVGQECARKLKRSIRRIDSRQYTLLPSSTAECRDTVGPRLQLLQPSV